MHTSDLRVARVARANNSLWRQEARRVAAPLQLAATAAIAWAAYRLCPRIPIRQTEGQTSQPGYILRLSPLQVAGEKKLYTIHTRLQPVIANKTLTHTWKLYENSTKRFKVQRVRWSPRHQPDHALMTHTVSRRIGFHRYWLFWSFEITAIKIWFSDSSFYSKKLAQFSSVDIYVKEIIIVWASAIILHTQCNVVIWGDILTFKQ